MLKAEQATCIGYTHGTCFHRTGQYNESITRVGDNVLSNRAQVLRRPRDAVFFKLSAKKSNSAFKLPSVKKADRGAGHFGIRDGTTEAVPPICENPCNLWPVPLSAESEAKP